MARFPGGKSCLVHAPIRPLCEGGGAAVKYQTVVFQGQAREFDLYGYFKAIIDGAESQECAVSVIVSGGGNLKLAIARFEKHFFGIIKMPKRAQFGGQKRIGKGKSVSYILPWRFGD